MPQVLEAAAEAGAQPTRTNAAGRLLAVLDAFGPRSRALSLSEISRRSGLSLSTTHRLVHELLSWGALERDANGRYSIGVRLLELAALAPRGLDLREAAFPILDDLHHRTRGNVHLGVRNGLEVVYVEAIRACATHPTNGRIGDSWPMHDRQLEPPGPASSTTRCAVRAAASARSWSMPAWRRSSSLAWPRSSPRGTDSRPGATVFAQAD